MWMIAQSQMHASKRDRKTDMQSFHPSEILDEGSSDSGDDADGSGDDDDDEEDEEEAAGDGI